MHVNEVDMAIPLLNGSSSSSYSVSNTNRNSNNNDTTIIWISRNDKDSISNSKNNKSGFLCITWRIIRALILISIIGILAVASFALCSSLHHDDRHTNSNLEKESESVLPWSSVPGRPHPLLRGTGRTVTVTEITSESGPTPASSTLVIMREYSDSDSSNQPKQEIQQEMEMEYTNMIMMMTSFMATLAREMEVMHPYFLEEDIFAGSLSGFEEQGPPSTSYTDSDSFTYTYISSMSPCPYASAADAGTAADAGFNVVMETMPMVMATMQA